MLRFKEVAYGLSPYGSWSQKKESQGVFTEKGRECENTPTFWKRIRYMQHLVTSVVFILSLADSE